MQFISCWLIHLVIDGANMVHIQANTLDKVKNLPIQKSDSDG